MKSAVIEINPNKVSGMPVFAGTRVPVKALVDYLSDGDTIDAFVDDFPTVSREQAIDVMKGALEALNSHASAA